MTFFSRLQHFPVSFFSVILGFFGAVIAFQKAEEVLHFPFFVSPYLLSISLFLFLFILTLYGIKSIFLFSFVKKEFQHPIKINFFPTISISFLLLSIALSSLHPLVSEIVWGIGSIGHFFLTLYIISFWMNHQEMEIHHMNPSWFIPAVGNILVPLGAPSSIIPEISWFFFSVGVIFWGVLLVIFFYRTIFHSPLPEELLPTLFILIAPPSVGFLSFTKLIDEMNPFGNVLYFFALFVLFLLITQQRIFTKIPFVLSWWAYSFPIAALTIASIKMFLLTEEKLFFFISSFFLFVLTLILLFLSGRTVFAIIKKEICVEKQAIFSKEKKGLY